MRGDTAALKGHRGRKSASTSGGFSHQFSHLERDISWFAPALREAPVELSGTGTVPETDVGACDAWVSDLFTYSADESRSARLMTCDFET